MPPDSTAHTGQQAAMTATGARRLVETLYVNGVTHIFCVPGESYLPVLDVLLDFPQIKVITCRHEAAAANMAVALGKLTGRPGVCFVTRAPGALHASIGVHIAAQDSVPMILFVGQAGTMERGREAFQEIDYAGVFSNFVMLAIEIDRADRVVELVTRAFAVAQAGRQGPVVLALPEDVLTNDAGSRQPRRVHNEPAGISQEALRSIAERLAKAQRPLVILGGGSWSSSALRAFSSWLRETDLPVLLSWRRKDLIDNDHPCYAGDLNIRRNVDLNERVKSADLFLVIGARLGEVPTLRYRLFTIEECEEKLIHVYPEAEELNRVWPAAVAVAADPSKAAAAIAGLDVSGPWQAWRREMRQCYERSLVATKSRGAVNLANIVLHMNEVLPHDTIICNGAGNYSAWLQRFYRHRARQTQLSPTSGAMGFGVPAGIAAKLLYPDREVVIVAGDGCFQMASQELATAAQYSIALTVIVVDNGSFGTIRMHQEHAFPGRPSATALVNPDFARLARALGGWGVRVERTEDFPAALAAARANPGLSLIHLCADVQDTLPGRTLDEIAQAAQSRRRAS